MKLSIVNWANLSLIHIYVYKRQVILCVIKIAVIIE